MPSEQATAGTYFDTPERAERLQLLLHLVRNAGEVIYLRAPSGAGKTAFAHRLLDEIADEMATVWLHAGQVDDVPAAAADQLGLDAEQTDPWPEAVLDALNGQELLLVVDNADQLDLAAFEQLAGMHARGGRLLLLGRGGLAQATGDWDVQFVDLPPFERQQTAAFLRGWAGDDAGRISDDMASALHLAARGMPGPLLAALNEVLA
ncbi:MAG: AAA family ATPase, partial [Gammaproteobacteria bacterium]|nr:AAA family ATPase [Gammaproteobacteria bacterium]